MFCANHPKVETFVRCGKCDTPICTNCMVSTPVGMRCRNCGSHANNPLFKANPRKVVLGFAVGLVAALLLGWLPRLFFVIGPAMYGFAVGEAVLRGSQRNRSLAAAVAAAAAALLGVLPWMLMMSWPRWQVMMRVFQSGEGTGSVFAGIAIEVVGVILASLLAGARVRSI